EQERVAGGAGDAVQRDYGAFTIAPAFITKVTRSSSVMSLSGSPETATRSACLPGAISPRSDFGHAFAPGLHSGSSRAPATDPSERITASGGIPASAISFASAAQAERRLYTSRPTSTWRCGSPDPSTRVSAAA